MARQKKTRWLVEVNPKADFDPRVIAVGNAAFGVWVRGIQWSAANGSARIPYEIAFAFGTEAETTPLFRERLWRVADMGLIDTESDMFRVINPRYRPPIPMWLRETVYERDGYRCLHCGATDRLSLDHIYPYSLGGLDTPENLQTLCMPCNSSKGARV